MGWRMKARGIRRGISVRCEMRSRLGEGVLRVDEVRVEEEEQTKVADPPRNRPDVALIAVSIARLAEQLL